MTEKQMEARAKKDRRLAQRLQLLLWMLEDWMNETDLQGMAIRQVTVRTGVDRGGEVLVIVKASFEDKPYVGFHSANDPESALRGALERIRNNDLKWKEDTPFEERAGQ